MLRQDPIDQLAGDAASQELEPYPRRPEPPPRPEPRIREPPGEGEVVEQTPGDQPLDDLLDLLGGVLPLDEPPPQLSA